MSRKARFGNPGRSNKILKKRFSRECPNKRYASTNSYLGASYPVTLYKSRKICKVLTPLLLAERLCCHEKDREIQKWMRAKLFSSKTVHFALQHKIELRRKACQPNFGIKTKKELPNKARKPRFSRKTQIELWSKACKLRFGSKT